MKPMKLNAIALAKIAAAPKPTAADILHTRMVMANSSRHGGDLRGSNKDRAARTQKLLKEFGNGRTCKCVYCGTVLDSATLTQDKIISGQDGGRYVYANLLPSCLICNVKRSDATVQEFITEAEAAIRHASKKLRRNSVKATR